MNLYGYVLQDPVNFVDPEGKSPAVLGLAIAVGVLYATDLETPGAAQDEMVGVPATVVGVKGSQMMCKAAKSNRYLRFGVGRNGGRKSLRAAGEVVQWLEKKGVPGIKDGHIDFIDLGPK